MAKVVVVDDDVEVRTVVVELLEGAGHEVLVADDGREGFDTVVHSKTRQYGIRPGFIAG